MNALVLRAVNEGSAILGDDPVKRAFYYHIGKRAKMKREEIPCKLDAFHKALVDLFDQGAWILERRMARILYEKLGVEFEEHDGWTLSDYVKHAERDLSKMI